MVELRDTKDEEDDVVVSLRERKARTEVRFPYGPASCRLDEGDVLSPRDISGVHAGKEETEADSTSCESREDCLESGREWRPWPLLKRNMVDGRIRLASNQKKKKAALWSRNRLHKGFLSWRWC